jgi:hypothetical protein
MIKIGSKNSLYAHRYFTEHLVNAFGKIPLESNLNHESLSLLIWWLKNYTDISLQWFTHKNLKRKIKTWTDKKKASETKPSAHPSGLNWTTGALASRNEKLKIQRHAEWRRLCYWLGTLAVSPEEGEQKTVAWDTQSRSRQQAENWLDAATTGDGIQPAQRWSKTKSAAGTDEQRWWRNHLLAAPEWVHRSCWIRKAKNTATKIPGENTVRWNSSDRRAKTQGQRQRDWGPSGTADPRWSRLTGNWWCDLKIRGKTPTEVQTEEPTGRTNTAEKSALKTESGQLKLT